MPPERLTILEFWLTNTESPVEPTALDTLDAARSARMTMIRSEGIVARKRKRTLEKMS